MEGKVHISSWDRWPSCKQTQQGWDPNMSFAHQRCHSWWGQGKGCHSFFWTEDSPPWPSQFYKRISLPPELPVTSKSLSRPTCDQDVNIEIWGQEALVLGAPEASKYSQHCGVFPSLMLTVSGQGPQTWVWKLMETRKTTWFLVLTLWQGDLRATNWPPWEAEVKGIHLCLPGGNSDSCLYSCSVLPPPSSSLQDLISHPQSSRDHQPTSCRRKARVSLVYNKTRRHTRPLS